MAYFLRRIFFVVLRGAKNGHAARSDWVQNTFRRLIKWTDRPLNRQATFIGSSCDAVFVNLVNVSALERCTFSLTRFFCSSYLNYNFTQIIPSRAFKSPDRHLLVETTRKMKQEINKTKQKPHSLVISISVNNSITIKNYLYSLYLTVKCKYYLHPRYYALHSTNHRAIY